MVTFQATSFYRAVVQVQPSFGRKGEQPSSNPAWAPSPLHGSVNFIDICCFWNLQLELAKPSASCAIAQLML